MVKAIGKRVSLTTRYNFLTYWLNAKTTRFVQLRYRPPQLFVNKSSPPPQHSPRPQTNHLSWEGFRFTTSPRLPVTNVNTYVSQPLLEIFMIWKTCRPETNISEWQLDWNSRVIYALARVRRGPHSIDGAKRLQFRWAKQILAFSIEITNWILNRTRVVWLYYKSFELNLAVVYKPLEYCFQTLWIWLYNE